MSLSFVQQWHMRAHQTHCLRIARILLPLSLCLVASLSFDLCVPPIIRSSLCRCLSLSVTLSLYPCLSPLLFPPSHHVASSRSCGRSASRRKAMRKLRWILGSTLSSEKGTTCLKRTSSRMYARCSCRVAWSCEATGGGGQRKWRRQEWWWGKGREHEVC